jgi:hypothetical protein
MNHLLFSHPFRKGFQVLLLLALLLFSFGSAGVAYAAPSNDSFANAKVVNAVAYSDTVDTSTAVVEDATDPTGFGPCDLAYLVAGYKSVWYKYTAATKGILAADTLGTDPNNPSVSYDTYIVVWTGTALNNLSFVACDDDTPAGKDAQVTWRAQAGVTYYVEVAQYKCTASPSCTPETPTTVPTLQFHMLIGGGPDTTGVFRPTNGLLYLKNQNVSGFADVAINYGLGGDYPVVGDWDGNGTATIGVYRNGMFLLRNSNTLGFAQLAFAFGAPGDQPIAGDWDGDGVDTIGVYRNGTFFLRNSNSAGAPNASFILGNPGDVGIAGDWNNDGLDTTGVFRPSNGALFLKNTNSTGFAEVQINYGLPGDRPVTGDWDGDGFDTIGVYRNGTFLLRNSNTLGFANIVFNLGNPGDMPIAGNWDGVP